LSALRNTPRATPVPVKVLAVLLLLFGLTALFGSLFLWGQGFILRFPAGVDLSFPVTDILVNAPACLVAAFGLWRCRKYGYIVSQFVAGVFMYASVVIFVQVAQGSLPMSIAILLPQVAAVIVALLLVFYLWRIQSIFD
jgi:hypothetical protein